MSAGWSAAACSYRKVGARCGRALNGTFLSPPPFWLKMTQRLSIAVKTRCLCTPLLVLNFVLNPSRKQGLFSKEVLGFFDLLKAKFLPYVKLGAALGTKPKYKICGEISGCI